MDMVYFIVNCTSVSGRLGYDRNTGINLGKIEESLTLQAFLKDLLKSIIFDVKKKAQK